MDLFCLFILHIDRYCRIPGRTASSFILKALYRPHKKSGNIISLHYFSPLITPVGAVFYVIGKPDRSPLQRGTTGQDSVQ